MAVDSWGERLRQSPQQVARSIRVDEKRVLTSGKAGYMLPVAAIPILREDAVRSSRLRLSVNMAETAEMLLNAVEVEAEAWFIPKLAFDRFKGGIDSLNRSYMGQPEADGQVIQWFVDYKMTNSKGNATQFYKTMGLHSSAPDARVNRDYQEAYNVLWNHKVRQRTNNVELRLASQSTLAPGFWNHRTLKHIKPTFDQALIDGEVPLNVVEGRLPVAGLYSQRAETTAALTDAYVDSAGGSGAGVNASHPTSGHIAVAHDGAIPQVFAEMSANGITVSMSNLELAKKTAAFARLRQQYSGYDDDQLVDLLMSGIAVPDQMLKQPMLLARGQSIIGMTKRYATDAGNLDKSATEGMTMIDLPVRLPQVNTGGVILIVCQVVPEQMFERTKDAYLHCKEVAQLPEYVRDFLDPEPVAVVTNDYVDTSHSAPDGVFGYAPLNHEWVRGAPNIGGKFYKTAPGGKWNENRNRIWAAEIVDPVLNSHFYLTRNIHHRVFADSNTDPFEVMLAGQVMIEGNTVFGPALIESEGDYDHVLAQADQERIDVQEPATDKGEDE